ncbi:MAG: hypothetical protein HYU63_03345, partial [Armatimonadetes bacterium]|nr:hypothetical protein [Armatimonadota bacterium]
LGENRLLIKEGLKKIKENPNLGIKALLETASFFKEVNCGALSFILAPRINAAGRMNKAELAVELMLEENFTQAKILAEKLNQYNRERQEEEAQIYKDIEKKLYLNPALLEEEILFLYSRHWHLGIIGIVASRITEKIKRPVFLASEADEIIKGSARTKGNYNIFEMLFNCKDLLENFGGHQNAGGFSLKKDKLEDFKNKLKDLSKNYPKVKDELNIDLELNFKDINLNLLKELELLAPFGQGNPPPLFLTKGIEISEHKLVGKPALHVRANFKHDGILYPAIGFKKNEYFESIKSEFHYDLVYNLELEYFQNSLNIKLEWQDLKLPDKICYILLKEPQQVYHQKNKEFQIIDARLLIDKSKYLKNILEHTPQGLILVRNFKETEKFDFLEEKFSNEIKKNAFMKGEERILVAPICQNENLGDKIFDLVYLHPPLSLEELVLKIKKINNLQIHFLFHYNELEKEKKIQEILAPSREKLIKIYSQLKKLTKEHFKVHLDYFKLVKLINDPLIHEITVKTALIIFKELDLLEFLTEKEKTWIILKEKSQNDLNNSKYFLKISAKKKAFYELEELIKLPKLEVLKQKLI